MADKIKISQIREQFPMYADLPDDKLLQGLRRKYYSDLKPGEFYSRIDFEDALDPTADMSWGEKLLAGYGGAVTDLARGVGQMVGVVDRQDVADARKRDAALKRDGWGATGNLTGNVVNMLPAMFVPGAATIPGAAAIGAVTGLFAPSTSTSETAQNTLLGGVIGPAANLAGRAIGGAYQFARGVIEPLTKSGQQRVTASTLQQFATDPQKAAQTLRAAKELVPGNVPTMGQASGDIGLAQLERSLANNPESGKELMARYAAQRANRLKAVQDIAGTDEHYKAIKAGRDLFAREDYAQAMAQGIDQSAAKTLQPQIKNLLMRPSIQKARNEAINLARESGVELKDMGSIQGLDWLKKGLDNLISKQSGVTNSAGKEGLRAMMRTKEELMSLLERMAPAYKAANDNFAAMSKQVNSMDVARDVLHKMQNPLARAGASTGELRNAYAQALEQSIESIKPATGQNLPLSAVMPSADIQRLQAVSQDMARQATLEGSGRATGSNTMQNLASQNLLRRTLGPLGMPQTMAESTALQTLAAPFTGIYRLGGAEQRILNALADAAGDPQEAARLLELAARPDAAALLGQKLAPLSAPAGLSSLLGYRAQQ